MNKTRGKMRYILLSFIMLLFVLILTACNESKNSGTDIPMPTIEKDLFIYDEGAFLKDDTIEKSNAYLKMLEEKTEVEFAVITVPSLEGESIENYANILFNQLGIGKKETNEGVLLLISKSDKRVRLEIGAGLEGVLTDATSGNILDDYFVPYREKDDYDLAVIQTVKAVAFEIGQDKEITLPGITDDNELLQEKEKSDIVKLVFIIIIVLFVVVIIIVVIVMFRSGGASGGYGGGFSSGGLSGGSSGGFSGGFSSGGGASR